MKFEMLTGSDVVKITGKQLKKIGRMILNGTMPIGGFAPAEGNEKDTYLIPKERFEKWWQGQDLIKGVRKNV